MNPRVPGRAKRRTYGPRTRSRAGAAATPAGAGADADAGAVDAAGAGPRARDAAGDGADARARDGDGADARARDGAAGDGAARTRVLPVTAISGDCCGMHRACGPPPAPVQHLFRDHSRAHVVNRRVNLRG
ncbi:hypothetical protein GCM10017750_40210 [Streptomyces racemochromogenes]